MKAKVQGYFMILTDSQPNAAVSRCADKNTLRHSISVGDGREARIQIAP